MRALAVSEYIVRFKNHPDFISGPIPSGILHLDDTFHIGDIHTVLRFLRNFGACIEEIDFANERYNQHEIAEICRYINNYVLNVRI